MVTSDRVETLMKEYNDIRHKQPNAPANLVRHLDTSMKTGLGLKEIYESFGIPFLNVLVRLCHLLFAALNGKMVFNCPTLED